jgi:hypothetical protein
MPRRILLKEDGLGSNLAPLGYRFIGLKDSNLASVGTSSKVEEFNTPQVFVVYPAFYFVEDLGNGFEVGPSGIQKVDYDLSGGNYTNISIEGTGFNSLTLPESWGRNLYNLMLEIQTLNSNPTEITLSNYPNLSSIKGTGLCTNGSKPYNFEIKDEVIDSRNLKSIGFYGSKRCTPVKTGPSLRIATHPNCNYSLGANSLESIELDFSSFTYSTFPSYSSLPRYDFHISLFSQNVNYLTFSNLSVYDDAYDSDLIFNFNGMSLTQSSVDQILLDLDTAFPYNMSNSPTINIEQQLTINPDSGYNELVEGESYVIESLNGSDDFSNVGFVEVGVPFVATGTTPTNWSNSTTVFTFYGMVKDYTLEIIDQAPADGKYVLGYLYAPQKVRDFYIVVSGGVITYSELLTPTLINSTFYPGQTIDLDVEDLRLIDEWGIVLFRGESPFHDIRLTVNSVTRTSAPTDGQNNTNKLSLESKGWKVNVNSY